MRLKKFQEGGPMDPAMAAGGTPEGMEGGAPAEAPAQGGGMEEQLMQVAQEIISQMGPEAAMMLADIIMQMVQGGGAPAEQPAFQRMGGRLIRRK